MCYYFLKKKKKSKRLFSPAGGVLPPLFSLLSLQFAGFALSNNHICETNQQMVRKCLCAQGLVCNSWPSVAVAHYQAGALSSRSLLNCQAAFEKCWLICKPCESPSPQETLISVFFFNSNGGFWGQLDTSSYPGQIHVGIVLTHRGSLRLCVDLRR